MIVLVVNCGSSSVKYELFDTTTEKSLASGAADRVGVNGGTQAILQHRPASGTAFETQRSMKDHETAMELILEALCHPEHGVISSLNEIQAVGHRVVHGGEKFAASMLIDEYVIAGVEEVAELAPLHNPANLVGIRACMHALPGVSQVAVFDTAFHQTIERRAYLYGLPYEMYEKHGMRRYGFHGTSHRYVSLVAGRLLTEAGVPADEQCIITVHLGNGCSMSAVKGGKSVDTTMGLTPLEGLLMGTRCGDLDPAIVPMLHDKFGMTPAEADAMLNKECGLLGVSGVSSDMRDLLVAAEEGNERAAAAIELFCYRVKKYIGAYSAALGGLHAVVFTAGIGENSSPIRAKCVENMAYLGINIDEDSNNTVTSQPDGVDISRPETSVRVYVIPTDEELLIARDTASLVSGD
ncbi:MAG: acetate kinase [candidate division WS1 bacterium]|nr:acetate kinase [candidate division WS1 bacterium]